MDGRTDGRRGGDPARPHPQPRAALGLAPPSPSRGAAHLARPARGLRELGWGQRRKGENRQVGGNGERWERRARL